MLIHKEKPLFRGSVALCGTSNTEDNDAPISDNWNEVSCSRCWAKTADVEKSEKISGA